MGCVVLWTDLTPDRESGEFSQVITGTGEVPFGSGCFLRALDRVSETRVTVVTEAALLQPHQKSQVAQCVIYRSYVFLLPGLVAFRQRIVHP